LTDQEIADRTEGRLAPHQVNAIGQSLSWDTIEVAQMRAFLAGCGLDFCDRPAMKRVEVYLKTRGTFRYLRRSPLWEIQFRHLVQRFRTHMATK
jgi:hypothetical protein